MAYDKHVWQCGEAITTEKLNHMEDGIAEGGGGAGYECTEELVTLTEESVTTELDGNVAYGGFTYSQLIDAESIKVTFNGTVYECEKIVYDGNNYGAPYDSEASAYDWSEYPFSIGSSTEFGNSIATETAGTYSVKIESVQEVATATPCFVKAVQAAMGEAVIAHMTEAYDSSTECTTYTLDITDDDVRQIVENGSKLKIIDGDNHIYYPVNIWARNATPALRDVDRSTAKITIIFNATPLVFETTTNDATPRYLTKTVCSSTNSSESR